MRLRSWAIPLALMLLVRCTPAEQPNADGAQSAATPDSAVTPGDTAATQDTNNPAAKDAALPIDTAGDVAPDAAPDTTVADTTIAQDTQIPETTDTGSSTVDTASKPDDVAEAADVAGAVDVPEPADTDPASLVCLGSVYPDSGVIDPDDPKFSDEMYDTAQVKLMFQQAKTANSNAYKAYKAALKYPELLECGFCNCGCAAPPANHISAIDCFKDMHGFG